MRNRTALVILLGVIFGISGAAYMNQESHKQRSPNSLNKKLLLLPSGKHLALLKIDISNLQPVPETDREERIEVLGRILVAQDLEQELSYHWHLPEGVEAVEGSVNERISGIKGGQIIELRLVVKGFTKEKQQLITLQAQVHQGEGILGNSSVLASRPEDTVEARAPEMHRAAQRLQQQVKERSLNTEIRR